MNNTLTIQKPKFWQRKGFKPILMLSIIIFIGILFVLVMPNVSKAAGSGIFDDSLYAWTDNPSDTQKKVAITIASFEATVSLCIMGLGKVVESILTFDTGGGVLSTAFTMVRNAVVNNIIPAFQAVGYGMVAMFFMVKLLEHATSGQMTLESFIKMFCKLIIGVVAVEYSPTIFKKFFEIGQALGNIVKGISIGGTAGTLSDFDTLVKELAPEIASNLSLAGGLTWLIAMICQLAILIIILIVEIILMACAFFVSFSRMFEICLRGAFLPVGLALLSENGWQGGGGRYTKKFLACCAKIMVLLMVAKITTVFMNAVATSSAKDAVTRINTIQDVAGPMIALFEVFNGSAAPMLWGAILCIFIGIAGVGLMFKADGLVNDVFGV